MRNDFMFDLQRNPDLAMVQIELPLGLSFMSPQTSHLPYLLWLHPYPSLNTVALNPKRGRGTTL